MQTWHHMWDNHICMFTLTLQHYNFFSKNCTGRGDWTTLLPSLPLHYCTASLRRFGWCTFQMKWDLSFQNLEGPARMKSLRLSPYSCKQWFYDSNKYHSLLCYMNMSINLNPKNSLTVLMYVFPWTNVKQLCPSRGRQPLKCVSQTNNLVAMLVDVLSHFSQS